MSAVIATIVASVASTSKFQKIFYTLCKGCKSSVPCGTTVFDCTTCKKIKSRELTSRCPASSKYVSRYHEKGYKDYNCIYCLVGGFHKPHTDAQIEAMSKMSKCSGICELDQHIDRRFCRDCFALADTNDFFHAKLKDIREQQWQVRIAKKVPVCMSSSQLMTNSESLAEFPPL